MRHRPLFALALQIILVAWLFQTSELGELRFPLMLGAAILVPISLAIQRASLVRIACCLIVGLWVSLSNDVPLEKARTHLFDDVPGRLEGKVLRTNARGTSIVVHGELDLKTAPATQCTVLVQVRKPSFQAATKVPICHVGEYIVASVDVHVPRPPTGSTEPTEHARAMSCNASFIATTHAIAVVTPAGWLNQIIDTSVNTCRGLFMANTDSSTASVLSALVLGDQQGISAEHRSWYILSGTAHVLAVSGTHVALLASLLLAGFGGKVHRWWQAAVASCVLTAFVLLTGADPPAVRALFMALIVITGRMCQRSIDPLNVLGAVVLLQLLYTPSTLYSAGFILSTSATFSILVLMSPVHRAIEKGFTNLTSVKRWLGSALSLNIAASAGVGVPAAMMFGQFALWSPIVNLGVVPLMSLAMFCGILLLSFGWVFAAVASATGWTATMSIQLAELLIRTTASITPLFNETAATILAYGVLGTTIWLCKATSLRNLVARSFMGVTITVLLIQLLPEPPPEIFLTPSRHRVEVVVRTSRNSKHFIIDQSRALPYVRLLYEDSRRNEGGWGSVRNDAGRR